MFRRLFLLFSILIVIFSIISRRANISDTIRAVESFFRPVIHKETINHYAGIYREDPLFVAAIIKVESNFLTKAKSPRGALGLMQIMPNTAKEIAKELRMEAFKKSDLENPEINIHFGLHYLSKLRKDFGDHDPTILAAYNAGIKNVKDWLKENKTDQLTINKIEFRETQNFVKEVLLTYHWLKRYRAFRNKLIAPAIKTESVKIK